MTASAVWTSRKSKALQIAKSVWSLNSVIELIRTIEGGKSNLFNYLQKDCSLLLHHGTDDSRWQLLPYSGLQKWTLHFSQLASTSHIEALPASVSFSADSAVDVGEVQSVLPVLMRVLGNDLNPTIHFSFTLLVAQLGWLYNPLFRTVFWFNQTTTIYTL